MRNLIVCCDGTWNDPKNKDGGVPAPTNVRKLFEAVDLESPDPVQLTRYQSGVGTGGLLDKALGGVLGFGLGEDIRDCYQWLSDKYQAGDNIFIFGFSRGAFSARSLAGMICKFGLVDFNHSTFKRRDDLIKHIYQDAFIENKPLNRKIAFMEASNRVAFVGVWDTVGALGIPDDKAFLNIFDRKKKHRFPDVSLSPNVSQARHAVALNEARGSFTPTLWDTERDDASIKQIWFPGVHSDIGGGYRETGLSDITLHWMIREAADNYPGFDGIRFKEGMVEQIGGNPGGMLHDSYTGAMKVLHTVPRSIPDLVKDQQQLDSSVTQRRNNPPIQQGAYLPVKTFRNGTIEIDIYAKHQWYWTGIYLEAGKTYEFSAAGEWMDASIPAGPEGAANGEFRVGKAAHLVGSLFGKLEQGWNKVTHNKQGDFYFSRRVESAPWFALIGAIANGGNPNPDGTAQLPTQFYIGKHYKLEVKQSGYLYCFANDAWNYYGNNRGYVSLTVKES